MEIKNQENNTNLADTKILKGDPILYFLNVKLKLSPLSVGIFFLLLAIAMIPWAMLIDVWYPKEGLYSLKSSYHTWLGDILLSFTNTLILIFYIKFPKLLRRISNSKVIEDGVGTLEDLFHSVFGKIFSFKRHLIIIIISLVITAIMQWMWVRDGLYGWTETSQNGGISFLGWYHFIYFALELSIIINFLVNTFLTISLFRKMEEKVYIGELKYNFVRLCQYDSGGLKPLNDIAMGILIVFFTLGIYIALIVVSFLGTHPDLSELYIWQISELSSILVYVIAAPTIFFLVLTPIHRIMKRKKYSLYKILQEKDREIAILEKNSMNEIFTDLKSFDNVRFNDELFNLIRSLPSWPFNLKSIIKVISLTTLPLIPIIFELIIHKIF